MIRRTKKDAMKMKSKWTGGPDDRTWNVFFCGTGGQGVLTAAEICAVAAMHAGYHVKKSEVHGMAQRGGSVESHVRFGKKVYSPLIKRGSADFIVSFHEGEGNRLASYLGKGGTSFVPFLREPGLQPRDKRFANTFYLGMLSAFLPVPEKFWNSALAGQLKRALAENQEAFADGRKAGFARAGGGAGE
jgi:indolepyruvate ferredoxin oxidoreductase, beta subunit